jgi:hypothetical protein
MKSWKKRAIHWQLIPAYVAMVAVLLACGAGSGAATPTVAPSTVTPEALLRLENGAVELRAENQGWIPVAAETTFEIVGELQSTDPWMVTGNTFAVRDSTDIEEGLEAGDLVRVQGIILEDRTWLAHSIASAGEPPSAAIFLIGKVISIDPWVVNGITLNVTEDTVVSEGITPEMIVRVEILLLEDGTWEVLSIAPLDDFTDVPGCATVTATVVAVNGSELQLAGWPAITLGDGVIVEDTEGGASTLGPGQVVLVVVCPSGEAQIIITHIVILDTNEEDMPAGGGEKVLVCHKPEKRGGHTLSISSSAVPAHLGHGDKMGPCP